MPSIFFNWSKLVAICQVWQSSHQNTIPSSRDMILWKCTHMKRLMPWFLIKSLPLRLMVLCKTYVFGHPTPMSSCCYWKKGNRYRTWRVRGYLQLVLPCYHRILCANYVTMWDKSYLINCSELPPIKENRWNSESGGYIPVRYLALPAPNAVLEFIKYGCKAVCKGRCSCSNNLPYTLCYGGDTVNTIRLDIEDDNDEDK